MSVQPRASGLPIARARLRFATAAAFIGLAMTGLTGLTAGAGAASTAAAMPAAAVLSFTPNPYDYGTVQAGQTTSETFTLTNTAHRPAVRLP